MLLGARQFFERRGAPTPPLPYDAEVEYLESTGTQYIDTGFGDAFPLADKYISCRFALSQIPSSVTWYVFNSQLGRTIRNCIAAQYSTMRFRIGMNATPTAANGLDTSWHDVEISTEQYNRYYIFDGVKSVINTSQGALTTGTNFFLFSDNGGANIPSAKISSFSVRDTTTNQLLIDLISVRKNGVGYMYDKVSSTLLGNSGTGAFLYGSDKS